MTRTARKPRIPGKDRFVYSTSDMHNVQADGTALYGSIHRTTQAAEHRQRLAPKGTVADDIRIVQERYGEVVPHASTLFRSSL